MTTYIIGDVQGCFESLKRLLQFISFDIRHDNLWFVGDLVNRGPNSLETLRFAYQHRDQFKIVLGNHELSLLAMAFGAVKPKKLETMQSILNAPDCSKLLDWLLTLPLLHYDPMFQVVMVHAGIPPQWDLKTALVEANLVQNALKNDSTNFLSQLFGDEPSSWSDDLKGFDRLRYTVNALTRMRFCDANGTLNLSAKSKSNTNMLKAIGFSGRRQMVSNRSVHEVSEECEPCRQQPRKIKGEEYIDDTFYPWFDHPNRQLKETPVIFGHWAALEGKVISPEIIATDCGCVWGGMLRAVSLPDFKTFEVKCDKAAL